MFGRRPGSAPSQPKSVAPASAPVAKSAAPKSEPMKGAAAPAPEPAAQKAPPPPPPPPPERARSEEYYDVKTTVFNALIDTIDLTQLAKLDAAAAREEIRDIVSEIIQIKNVVMSIAEQEELLEDICNDVL
ncbi:MAG: CpaF family protein, partial [Hyphomicrobiaceae bacterium]|nr:CpaF family protein [Hyphomicrobiaceae bacterium]